MATVQASVLFDIGKLPQELQTNIFERRADLVISEVVNKVVFSNDDIKKAGRELIQLSEVCLELRRVCSKQVADIKMIYTLYNKYSVLNKVYHYPGGHFGVGLRVEEIVPCGNPQLLDLLSTEHPDKVNAVRSFEKFTDEQYQDMEQIVRLMPRSLRCNLGLLQTCHYVNAILMACSNPKIPVKAIEFLLRNGANVNSIYIFHGRRFHLLTLLRKANEDRYEQLKPILETNGSVEETFIDLEDIYSVWSWSHNTG